MGASSWSSEWKLTDETELKKEFEEVRQQSLYEDGHSPYSGGLGTLRGIRVVSDPFPGKKWGDEKKKEVIDYLLDHSDKWEYALAVKTNDSFLIAGWLAS